MCFCREDSEIQEKRRVMKNMAVHIYTGMHRREFKQQSEAAAMIDEDDVVKQLMKILDNRKELQIKSSDGKTIKLCLDDVDLHNNLENQFNIHNQIKSDDKGLINQEEEDYRKFEKILEEANDETQPISANQPQKQVEIQKPVTLVHSDASVNRTSAPNSTKKVSLNFKNKKQTQQQTNQAVISFLSDNNSKKNCSHLSTIAGSSTLTINKETSNKPAEPKQQQVAVLNSTPKKEKEKEKQKEKTNETKSKKDISKTIELLKNNHPEEKEHLDIISERMIELERMEMEKMKLDDEISSILSASFSNSISAIKFDSSSVDQSLLSLSALSIGGVRNANDPLCQLFSNYIRRTSVNKKTQGEKIPSFLFLYSQPMLDSKGQQIQDQINYFEEQSIIQKILKECGINYIREQATIDKFNYWIMQNISILHFCGHGTQDYLLFENHEGQSVNLSCTKLEKILRESAEPLKLVFVASCHSENAGKIFKEAGAVHVICIKENYQILDDACQQFARIFYHSCIKDQMPICTAYGFAKKQLMLSGKFNNHEIAKFSILCSHTEDKCSYKLDILREGSFKDLTFKPFYKKNLPSRVENFIPRPKDLHQILQLIQNKNRFITIVGCSGIGKSTLARQLVRYVQFRNLFKDGVIYLDIRSFESMRKIFESINLELFESSACSSGRLSKSFNDNVQRVVKELFDREVLIVFDNCQNIMISEDKKDFRKLIEAIMKNCDNVSFVFTHRSYIGRQIDYCWEKLYELGKLTDSQAETLFFQRAPRNIHKKQLEEFFRIEEVKDMRKHPFFQFLNGHPQAICMTASLLSERSLNQIYELLMKPNLTLPKKMQEDENQENLCGTNPLVETALKISLNVLKNKHKDAVEMIKTLSLLPIGVDSQTMFRLFGQKWKETSQKLIHHSLVHSRQIGGAKHFSVHPYIIMHVESEISNEQKLKLHEKIADQFQMKIYRIYKFIGTLSQKSQKLQEEFLADEENYKAIIYREFFFAGFKNKLRRLYTNLFQADCTDDEHQGEDEKIIDHIKNEITSQAVEGVRKKRVYNEKIQQPTKKQSISKLIVYYVTILFITKSPSCHDYIDYGIYLSRVKKQFVLEANLLRIKGCLAFNKNNLFDAKDCFLKSWDLYAIEGCGLGSAGCEAAVGYIRLIEAEYAMAKKNLENALKYYESIAHPFGKHYLNRWLLSLKTKMNRAERELISHHEEAQKLLKQTKVLLKTNSFANTYHSNHKLGKFVFRFTFDNLSLFLETSFQLDVRPKIINEIALKKTEERGQPKFLDDFDDEEQNTGLHKRNLYKHK